MKQQILLLAILCLALANTLHAQGQETIFGSRGFSGIWGSFTNNYSFFGSDEKGHFDGGNIGMEFGRTVFLGWGWSKLKDNVRLEGTDNTFQLDYKGPMLAIMPSSYRALHPILQVHAGRGQAEINDGDRERLFVIAPSAGVEINVFKWFHLGLQGGYRFTLENDRPDIPMDAFESPFAQLDLRFGISWGGY